uniref:FH2 domain-containing protein n=1 Tax=Strigamia maritima TaxID=126957 RepID=T1IHU6_STRMM
MSLTCRVQYLSDVDPFSASTNTPEPTRPPYFTFNVNIPLINQIAAVHHLLKAPHRLDDCTLQIYKANGTSGEHGTYLDLESTINEQGEDFEGFNENRKNSILVRTQLSVRVHSIIEKLLNSEGKELRRALFSLKQIFQDDKDLVHEFVQNNGLASLIKVGCEADQNYQNYILRALGQVMLYVDGMNGVINHPETVQWFYSLIATKYRLVVKTAIKLLLVFVEYTETNCTLLVKTITNYDINRGVKSWSNIMQLLGEKDSSDMELLVFATTLINKTLYGIPDQDTYYDMVDALEEQGMERIIQKYMSKQGTDLDLLQQFHIYEAVLKHEDGEDDGRLLQMESQVRQIPRSRKSNENNRRKSWRHGSVSTGNSPYRNKQTNCLSPDDSSPKHLQRENRKQWLEKPIGAQINGCNTDSSDLNGVTPALRRRRERQDRQQMFIKEQEETVQKRGSLTDTSEPVLNSELRNGNCKEPADSSNVSTPAYARQQSWVLSMLHTKSQDEEAKDEKCDNGYVKETPEKTSVPVSSPQHIDMAARINLLSSNLSGIVSKAKEGLINQCSRNDEEKSPTLLSPPALNGVEPKKENDLQWEQLMSTLDRPLIITDLDFTDLGKEDDINIFQLSQVNNNFGGKGSPSTMTNGAPHGIGAPPPPPPGCHAPPPPPLTRGIPPPPALINVPPSGITLTNNNNAAKTIKKNKKTIKLFWKDVHADPVIQAHVKHTIWDDLKNTSVDVQKLEHLFENRVKDVVPKDRNLDPNNKSKEVIVLGSKRSNTINIGMTKLPPPRTIKTAILKMDNTIMNREGIEKILTNMIPSEEEKSRIAEAQVANPEIPLGSAEQFLLTLASISELPARLKLWAFKLDYEQMEVDVAEPLMDLKQCISQLNSNKTFRYILSTLLSIGNFLNGIEAKGFQIDYLAKVPEVKDTVHKHSLLHHLCHMVMEKYSDSTDLYSEIGSVTRASKVDFDELAANLNKMEIECKSSWDRLKLIAKHDGSSSVKVVKMSEFLADCAERIIVLGIVHRRVLNRFYRLLCFFGVPSVVAKETKVNQFLRVISEFSLEYSTTRERVVQQMEKKANHRERNKTRGKMITDMEKFKSKDVQADEELRQLLVTGMSDTEDGKRGSFISGRARNTPARSSGIYRPRGNSLQNEYSHTDGDDEILGLAAKAVAKSTTRATPRERKRARQADRKSCNASHLETWINRRREILSCRHLQFSIENWNPFTYCALHV